MLLKPLLFVAAVVAIPHEPIRRSVAVRETALAKRDIFDSISNFFNNAISGAKNLTNIFDNLSTSDILGQFGIGDDALANSSLKVLNLGPYANYSNGQWFARFHGRAYKDPKVSNDTLDKMASFFLVDLKTSDITPAEKAQSYNVSASILAVPQDHIPLSFDVWQSGQRLFRIPLKDETDGRGEFDEYLPLPKNSRLRPGDTATSIQVVRTYANASDSNATAWLVPNKGLTIVSDIDDILRFTQIYSPKAGLDNSFAYAYKPWMNMPSIYANWSSSLPKSTHFHYLTTLPIQFTRIYQQFIFNYYPWGSFDVSPLNLTSYNNTFAIRREWLIRIIQTYPERKFVLVGDTSNRDIMSGYPQVAVAYPNNVACILLRNTTATDANMTLPYDTSEFKPLNGTGKFFFFNVPDDIKGLDLEGGQCVNRSVHMNVTFGMQGGPGNTGKSAAVALTVAQTPVMLVAVVLGAMAWLL